MVLNISPEEVVVKEINQDIARRSFKFWRKFSITLTAKRLHAYEKLIFSQSQKTFDLKDIDSIYQAKVFNGVSSFFYGAIACFTWMFIGGTLAGFFSYVLRDMGGRASMQVVFVMGAAIWAAIFLMYFFKRVLVVCSRNDEMRLDVLRLPEGTLGDFVQSVLKEKEKYIGNVSPTALGVASSENIADKLKQLNDLKIQGLISEREFETKKTELLKRF